MISKMAKTVAIPTTISNNPVSKFSITKKIKVFYLVNVFSIRLKNRYKNSNLTEKFIFQNYKKVKSNTKN